MKILRYKVEEECVVRNVLKNHFLMSERFIRKLKKAQRIKCNDENVYLDYKLQKNDVLTIDIEFDEVSDGIEAENIPLDVLYEDDFMLIVNKPSNMVVHPTCLHQNHTLANAVSYYLASKNELTTIRFVNRLDKDTTGVVIFAKSEYIQECLVRSGYEKEYIAILDGVIDMPCGTIDLAIKRDESSIMLRKIDCNGERAITHFEVLKVFNDMTLMRYMLETGRTHQIRVHSKAIGATILGDDLYGKKSELIDRQALHAHKISFIHPITKEKIEVVAEVPEDMQKIIYNK